ncbi:Atxe2 family lasso peptide isopeptidase [Sphingobium yanoikuyae]|uniref:Atxe2 family lasso peptide isopeptidase n=2 Tax=Sphingobium yanoikuyae TaxID=13690 RepID=A0A6M4GAU5_SPHYA|nr:Atxe2 family lasso peptide isopeptidase [Sphingobium yanoikuyae]
MISRHCTRVAALMVLCAISTGSRGSGLPRAEPSSEPEPEPRSLTASALVELADIGPPSPVPDRHILTLSPDGRRAVIQVRQADPGSNGYRLRMIVVDIAGKARPITIDEGGEFIREMVNGVGGVRVATGDAAAIPVEWSRDGSQVYFLKRMNRKTQIWRAAADGHGSAILTHEQDEVEDFHLSPDKRRLYYSVRSILPDQNASSLAEQRNGFRYDRRFIPLFAQGPDAVPAGTLVTKSLEVAGSDIQLPPDTDLALPQAHGRRAPNGLIALSLHGRVASISSKGPLAATKQGDIIVQDPVHGTVRCSLQHCSGGLTLWWTQDGRRLRYMRREGWADEKTAIYEWKPGNGAPRRLYSTSDLLLDCQPTGSQLICARERSTAPRHIISLDVDTGRARIIYDPNPDFGGYRLGRVERLFWRNAFGVETFGDLVYPVNYTAGRAYPLVVVQYISRGFLRGGVGDEFPIQLFANRGYAVLSVQRPDARDLVPNATEMNDFQRQLLKDFKDRRSVLSSIEIGVKMLIGRGIVDPVKVGLTGLSDGSSTVQFAAINSKLFKAASVSGCCWDQFQDAVVGPSAAQAYHQIGWPKLLDYDATFWSQISLVKNAKRITMPILMQQSDDEFRVAVPSYTALRQAGHPTALFVFPDENHIKWQPAHRLAVYQRNVRWFDYWLMGIGDGEEWKENGTSEPSQ